MTDRMQALPQSKLTWSQRLDAVRHKLAANIVEANDCGDEEGLTIVCEVDELLAEFERRLHAPAANADASNCVHRIVVTPRSGAPHGAGFACGLSGGHCFRRDGCGFELADQHSQPATPAGCADKQKLYDQNAVDAEQFCKGAFGHFVVDTSQYARIVAELMQHATDRALAYVNSQPATPAESGIVEFLNAVYDAIGDIDTDKDGNVRWPVIANIQREVGEKARILAERRSQPATPAESANAVSGNKPKPKPQDFPIDIPIPPPVFISISSAIRSVLKGECRWTNNDVEKWDNYADGAAERVVARLRANVWPNFDKGA